MTLNEYKIYFQSQLEPIYDQEEIKAMFFITIEEIMGYKRVDYILKEKEILSAELLKKMNAVLQKLVKHCPIQYIFEKAYFFGYQYKVSSHTLIPRSETEELVEWILQTIKQNPEKKWKILDIGTGSGCIAITLKKEFPEVEVTAMDISEEALQIARENAKKLNAEINFLQQNILQTDSLDRYDVIVSNPPYVRDLEKKEIQKNVLNFEPHLALFVQDHNPLIFYEKIVQLAYKHLNEKGFLFFEINQYLGKEMHKLAKQYFQNVFLRKDALGNDRMMKINQ